MLLIECFYGIPLILPNLVIWAPVIFCHGMEESFKMIVLNRLQHHLSGGYCFCFVIALFIFCFIVIVFHYSINHNEYYLWTTYNYMTKFD